MAGSPEPGSSRYRWEGYDEALLLYVLGLGSPTHPLPAESYAAWTATYQWKKLYGIEFLYAGPLFTHQLSHLWIDFRGIQDAFMREQAAATTSRTAGGRPTCSRSTRIRNPLRFAGYGEHCWGITACDGPGFATAASRRTASSGSSSTTSPAAFPFGPDDGTLGARGPSSPRCRSRRRSSCPRSGTSGTRTRKPSARTGS